jgi:hypothetical protein
MDWGSVTQFCSIEILKCRALPADFQKPHPIPFIVRARKA